MPAVVPVAVVVAGGKALAITGLVVTDAGAVAEYVEVLVKKICCAQSLDRHSTSTSSFLKVLQISIFH